MSNTRDNVFVSPDFLGHTGPYEVPIALVKKWFKRTDGGISVVLEHGSFPFADVDNHSNAARYLRFHKKEEIKTYRPAAIRKAFAELNKAVANGESQLVIRLAQAPAVVNMAQLYADSKKRRDLNELTSSAASSMELLMQRN